LLFNCTVQEAFEKVQENQMEEIMIRTLHMLGCTDDVILFGRNLDFVNENSLIT
jgi:hypothetical protein